MHRTCLFPHQIVTAEECFSEQRTETSTPWGTTALANMKGIPYRRRIHGGKLDCTINSDKKRSRFPTVSLVYDVEVIAFLMARTWAVQVTRRCIPNET